MVQGIDGRDLGARGPTNQDEIVSTTTPAPLWTEIGAAGKSTISPAPNAGAATGDETLAPCLVSDEHSLNPGQGANGTVPVNLKPPAVAVQDANAKVTDEEVIEWLATLTPMEYDRSLREKARELGVKVRTLDMQVKAARNTEATKEILPFPEVEPWPAPVDPAQLLHTLVAVLLRFVVMTMDQAIGVALWIAFTWFIHDVEVAALLIITAPERACGKSQLLTIVGYLVARPISAANSSPSFLFRSISMWRPTLLIDEADTFFADKDELKGMINAGHTRASAFVGRTVAQGDGHAPVLFDVWAAKALAGIALEKILSSATLSRGVIVGLRRKLPDEDVERLRHAPKELFATLASKLARFAEDYSEQVRKARPVLPDALSDRDQDNWEPLLAIAQCAGTDWLQSATKAAIALSASGDTSASAGNELLADIQQVFEKLKVEKIRTADLIDALISDEEKGWSTFNHGKPVNPRQLAKLLATYGIRPKTVRRGTETPKGYERAQFDDAFVRYLSPQKLPQQGNAAAQSDVDDQY